MTLREIGMIEDSKSITLNTNIVQLSWNPFKKVIMKVIIIRNVNKILDKKFTS